MKCFIILTYFAQKLFPVQEMFYKKTYLALKIDDMFHKFKLTLHRKLFPEQEMFFLHKTGSSSDSSRPTAA